MGFLTKKRASLGWEIFYDLVVMSLCVLVLSIGLVILLLRTNLPQEFQPLSSAYVQSLHQAFLSSEVSDEGLKDEELKKAFKRYLETGTGLQDKWSNIEFSTAQGYIAQPSFRVEKASVLFFFSRVKAFHWTFPVNEDQVFQYRWDATPLHEQLTKSKYFAFLLALIFSLGLVLAGYYLLFRRNILLPVQNLNETAHAFLEENWDARCTVNRRDELGHIAEVLNQMAHKIQEKEKKLVLSIESLKKANEEIEATKNEQLQIEKLASVGRLAAGVAHEVGNPLGAISGYIDILRSVLDKAEGTGPDDKAICDRIEQETNRISKIIRALLQQARPPKDRIRPVQLKEVMTKAVELAQLPETIEVSYDFEDENAEALCEKDQLVQVVLNLIINAKHAIEQRESPTEPGRIDIRCALRKLPQYQQSQEASYDTSVVRALKPQTYWVLVIHDNGIGISEEDQKKLFEPFFSTKGPGKGTGLGLYVAKSIIESFRGAIVLRSAVGYGTSFSIFLPKGL